MVWQPKNLTRTQREECHGSAHMTVVLSQVACCALCGIMQDPLSGEVQIHAAIPTLLDQLEVVDVAFDRTCRPRECQRGFHVRIISLEPADEVSQLHTGAGTTGPQPCIPGVGEALADHRRTVVSRILFMHDFRYDLPLNPRLEESSLPGCVFRNVLISQWAQRLCG
jgi:hypothetical protein